MRAFVILLIAVAFAAGAVRAQSPEFEPQWATAFEAPRGFYPDDALDHRRNGEANLCCAADSLGRLACRSIDERPARAGFGAAAVHASEWLELTEESAAALLEQEKGISLSMRFRIAEGRPSLDTSRGFDVLTRSFTPRIELAYRGLCTLPDQSEAPHLLDRQD